LLGRGRGVGVGFATDNPKLPITGFTVWGFAPKSGAFGYSAINFDIG
jgi:hypothetical protein